MLYDIWHYVYILNKTYKLNYLFDYPLQLIYCIKSKINNQIFKCYKNKKINKCRLSNVFINTSFVRKNDNIDVNKYL